MKKVFITLMIAFVTISSFATEYETVYSCGFEDSETDAISKWDLVNAADYKTNLGYTQSDLFNIGSYEKHEGEKSMYVSQDGGITDSVKYAANEEIYATADLNLALTSGNYTLSFDYLNKTPQHFEVDIFNDRFVKISSDSISQLYVQDNNDSWSSKEISFKIPEGKSANWIIMYFSINRVNEATTFGGVCIDNVLLKKEKTSSGVSLAKSMSIVVASSNGTVRIAGTQEKATIYNLGGAKVYEGTDREIALPSGVYVVRIGTVAKKVIVK